MNDSASISLNLCRQTLRGIGNTPPEKSWFPVWMLCRHLHFSWDPEPDFLFYGDIENRAHLNYPSSTIRIFLTGENVLPDWDEADYAMTHERIWSERHWRVPFWRHYYDTQNTRPVRAFSLVRDRVSRFCNFVVSNDRAEQRIRFFQQLARYKNIDSGGRVLNNLGGPVADKLSLLASSKFTIAFENESHPGYATEKIIQPLLVGSIPIYWGDPHIEEDFNPECFINVHRFKNFDAVIDEVVRIDQNVALWEKYVTAPIFSGDRIPYAVSDDAILDFCRNIFTKRQRHVNRFRKIAQRARWKIQKSKVTHRAIQVRAGCARRISGAMKRLHR